MTPQLMFGLKVGALSMLIGLAVGGMVAHAWYSPLLELERTRVQALADKMTEQNNAIGALQKAAELQADQSRQATDAANKARLAAETAAQGLRTLQLPAGADPCTAASALITQELRR